MVSWSPGSAKTNRALPYLVGSSEIESVTSLFWSCTENEPEAISTGNLVSLTNEDQGGRDTFRDSPKGDIRFPHF